MKNEMWYALMVRPRSEWMVAANLENRGYDYFLPSYKTKRRWSDRTKVVDVPLFPGYLFCRFDAHARLPILTTPGVNMIVGTGKTPDPIDPDEIEAVRTVALSGMPCQPHPYLAVGQQVRIEEGSLVGLNGIVTEVKNQTRLIISVRILMRSVAVEIDRSWIRPLTATPAMPVCRENFLPSSAAIHGLEYPSSRQTVLHP